MAVVVNRFPLKTQLFWPNSEVTFIQVTRLSSPLTPPAPFSAFRMTTSA